MELSLNHWLNQSKTFINSEQDLHNYAEKHAGGVVNLQPLPYTTDRQKLFEDLKKASLAIMPSWHEGFGLVGWEAIAAEVPLIVSKQSGLFKLLKESHAGLDEGYVWAVDVRASNKPPYFSQKDLELVSDTIIKVAQDSQAREKAKKLKTVLAEYSWSNCASTAIKAFGWDFTVLPNEPALATLENKSTPEEIKEIQVEIDGLHMPQALLLDEQGKLITGRATTGLLKANEAVVEFDPLRQNELDTLLSWISNEFPISVRLITGAGGMGKTRLAQQLCIALTKAKTSWNVGFLTKNIKLLKLKKLWQQLMQEPVTKPCLLVIDYAETQGDTLIELVKLSLTQPSTDKVRILLLARDGGEWWENLKAKDSQAEDILGISRTAGHFSLPALYDDLSNRKAGYQRAINAFAKCLSIDPNNRPEVDLSAEHFAIPLYIQMSALLALYDQNPQSAGDITQAILNHEQRYWTQAMAENNVDCGITTTKQLLTLATLAGNYPTAKTAFSTWEKIDPNGMSRAEFVSLFNCLVPLYPGYQGLHGVKPDLLGEALVGVVLTTDIGANLLSAVFSKSNKEVKTNALTVLARLSLHDKPELNRLITQTLVDNLSALYQELIEVCLETRSNLPQLATAALDKITNPAKSSLVKLLSDLLTVDSISLNVLRCKVKAAIYQQQADKWMSFNKVNNKSAKKIFEQRRLVARAAYNYSLALADVGDDKPACEHAEIAVHHYQMLANDKRNAKVPALINKDNIDIETELAGACVNFGTQLRAEVDFKNALLQTEQALELFKQLITLKPDKFERSFCLCMTNLSALYADIEDHIQALDYSHQALAMEKKRHEKSPESDSCTSDYALSLQNNAVFLNKIGQLDEAIVITKQALELRKQLSQDKPDSYEPYYAVTLSFLGVLAGYTGDYQAAQVYSQQTLSIFEQLVSINPERFNANLANALSGKACCFANTGDYRQALEEANTARKLYQHLYRQTPKVFAEQLIECLYLQKFVYWLIHGCINRQHSQQENDEQLILEAQKNLTSSKKNKTLVVTHYFSGLMTTDKQQRTCDFSQVLTLTAAMNEVDKRGMQEDWLIAAAWLHQNVTDNKLLEAEAVQLVSDWPKEWQRFKQERNDNLPEYIKTIAERLGLIL